MQRAAAKLVPICLAGVLIGAWLAGTLDAAVETVVPTTGHRTGTFGPGHDGVDIAKGSTQPGEPVYAFAGGEVTVAGPAGYGCTVEIDHGDQGGGVHLISTYGHMGHGDCERYTPDGPPFTCYIDVSPPNVVLKGQKIGNQGCSGDASGVHLHFKLALSSTGAFNPETCIGSSDDYTALTPGSLCGPGQPPTDPPSVSVSVSPPPNGAGWNNTNVSVDWTVTGATEMSGCEDVTLTNETPGIQPTCTARNDAGTTVLSTPWVIRIDKTAPAIGGSRSPGPNANGWNNTDVTVHFDCSDVGAVQSGIASCTGDQVVSAEGANQSRSGTATDNAGNSASATVGGINIDMTLPTFDIALIPPPNAYGWHNTDVTVDFTCADNLSGVAFCGPDQVFTEEGRHWTGGTVCDLADNCLSVDFIPINIDKTPPHTNATLDPDSANGKNGWYVTPVEVCLSADDPLLSNGDEPSGVAATYYRVSPGPWQDYIDCFTLGEGRNLVEFYSEDFADNVEPTNAITVLIDWTPPEARVGYNEGEHFTDLWGVDNLSDVTVSPDDLAVGTHFYLLEDEAGNTLNVELNLHGWGATQEARIFSLQYGTDPKLKLPYTHLFRHDNRWPQIGEYCWLSGQFSVSTLYRTTLDKTRVSIWTNAGSSSEDMPGLVHLVLATNKGALSFIVQ